MLIEARIMNRGNSPTIVLDTRNGAEGRIESTKGTTKCVRSRAKHSNPAYRCLEEPVLFDVVCELIEPDLHRRYPAESPSDLLVESDTPADSEEGAFFKAVASEKSPPNRSADLPDEPGNDCLDKILRLTE